MNRFARHTQAVALAILATLGILTAPSPASASVGCHVVEPSMRGDRTLDLLMWSSPSAYTGRPFSFTVRARRIITLGGVRYWTRTYSPVGKGYHTTQSVPSGYRVIEVGGSAWGTPCAAWER